MGEVNYFSSKVSIERNLTSPVVFIPSIGVNEKINNVSLDQGVLYESNSYTPGSGDVLIFGHRTLQGSPFLRLNELHNKVKNAAYEIIAIKGATYYAVALAVSRIVEAIINNTNSVLTVSTLIEDESEFGIKDFYFSLPCIVNSKGIERVLRLDYSLEEKESLIASGKKIRDLIIEVNN